MATNPTALLTAAGIFGNNQPNINDPRIRALFHLPPLPQSPLIAPPSITAPVAQAAHVFSPPVAPPQPTAADVIGNWAEGPQGFHEPNIGYSVRRAVSAPVRAAKHAVDDVSQFAQEAMQTPADRQRQPAAHPFATDYTDPSYDQYEATVATGYNNPTMADALAKLRTLGERSNNGQVSSAGARTPYQITPSTRAAIMKQHGFDPWASPANAARGAAIVLSTYTGPNANFNDPAVMAKAAGGYFAGKAGADNPFGSASDGNNTTGQYVQRVLGPDTKLPFPAVNAYNPGYDQAALAQVGAERKALMTPFSASVNVGPAPVMPKPEDLPKTDFSQEDAALQALRPVEMTDKEKMQRQRADFFEGMGKAMASMSGNEGIGTFLMKLGGGALMGKAQAMNEIKDEQSKFDDKMARFNQLVYLNKASEAATVHQEAVAQVQQNNNYNADNWKMAYDRWSKNGNIDISGTNAIISQTDDKTGIKTVRTLPIAGAVDAAMAQQRAQIFQGMSGRSEVGNEQITSMTNAITGRVAIATMLGHSGAGQSEQDAAATAAPAMYGTYIATHGLTADVLGPDGAKSLEQSVQKQLQQQMMMPGSKEYTDRHDQIVATELTKLALANPSMMRSMVKAGGSMHSFMAAQALQHSRETTRTDSKGQTTTSTTQPMAADIFGGDTTP